MAVGNPEAARTLFEELAVRDSSDLPAGIRYTSTMVEVIGLCADLEDEARARILCEGLGGSDHFHGVLPVPICYGGPFKWPLARLHTLLGKSDEALQLYEDAVESASSLGARPMVARIQLDQAITLERRRD